MSIFLGEKLRLSIYGESHGPAIGAVLEGLPPGEEVDVEALTAFMARRAPGQSPLATARREADSPRFLSGIREGRLCGDALSIIIENTNAHSGDYENLRDVPRPGHGDYGARCRYGGFMDMRGGGPFSGRLTAPLCAAGGIALQLLARRGVGIVGHIAQIGGIPDRPFDPLSPEAPLDPAFPVLDSQAGARMREAIMAAKEAGDSLGGIAECAALGLPPGLGGPLFEGLEGRLALMLFAIPAMKGLEFGAGFAAAACKGSGNNDPFTLEAGELRTGANRHGGLLGGITTGMPLLLRAAFKPTPSIALLQRSVNLSRMEACELRIQGRHDPCIVPRALPAVEAGIALVVLDAILAQRIGE